MWNGLLETVIAVEGSKIFSVIGKYRNRRVRLDAGTRRLAINGPRRKCWAHGHLHGMLQDGSK